MFKKISLLLLVLFVSVGFADNKQPKKFKVTFELTYNEIDLEKAAEIEKELIKKYSDCCKINIKVGSLDENNIRSGILLDDQIPSPSYDQGQFFYNIINSDSIKLW